MVGCPCSPRCGWRDAVHVDLGLQRRGQHQMPGGGGRWRWRQLARLVPAGGSPPRITFRYALVPRLWNVFVRAWACRRGPVRLVLNRQLRNQHPQAAAYIGSPGPAFVLHSHSRFRPPTFGAASPFRAAGRPALATGTSMTADPPAGRAAVNHAGQLALPLLESGPAPRGAPARPGAGFASR